MALQPFFGNKGMNKMTASKGAFGESSLDIDSRKTRLWDLDQSFEISDFEHVRFVGKGAHSIINLAKWNLNNQYYALKTCDKEKVIRFDYINNLFREKDILSEIDHPNVVKLEGTFKDETALYFCLEYHSNGDLASLIRNNGPLPLNLTRFYVMQLINALERMQEHKVVHRDIKPENILIDESFHCWIADFGWAKHIDPDRVDEEIRDINFTATDLWNDEVTEFEPNFDISSSDSFKSTPWTRQQHTFVGTPIYVSPEMLLHNIACYGSDLWGLGWILYQCLCGIPPFQGATQTIIYEQILWTDYSLPNRIDAAASDLIKALLKLDPTQRLGAGAPGSLNDMEALKNHVFFKNQCFKAVHRLEAPQTSRLIIPSIDQDDDDSDIDDFERASFHKTNSTKVHY